MLRMLSINCLNYLKKLLEISKEYQQIINDLQNYFFIWTLWQARDAEGRLGHVGRELQMARQRVLNLNKSQYEGWVNFYWKVNKISYSFLTYRNTGSSTSSDEVGDIVETRKKTFLTNRDRKSIRSLRFQWRKKKCCS